MSAETTQPVSERGDRASGLAGDPNRTLKSRDRGAADSPLRPLHTTTVRLGYADTDPAGIVYYAAWFPMMERLQTEFFYLEDLAQETLADRFGFWTVTRRTECEYLVPVGLHELIRIELHRGATGTTSFTSLFRMVRVADEALVARASATLVTVDRQGRPIAVPELLRGRLQEWDERARA